MSTLLAPWGMRRRSAPRSSWPGRASTRSAPGSRCPRVPARAWWTSFPWHALPHPFPPAVKARPACWRLCRARRCAVPAALHRRRSVAMPLRSDPIRFDPIRSAASPLPPLSSQDVLLRSAARDEVARVSKLLKAGTPINVPDNVRRHISPSHFTGLHLNFAGLHSALCRPAFFLLRAFIRSAV